MVRLAEEWVWPHGSKSVRAETRRRGPGEMRLRAWRDAEPDDVLIGIEDNVRLRCGGVEGVPCIDRGRRRLLLPCIPSAEGVPCIPCCSSASRITCAWSEPRFRTSSACGA